MSLKKIQKLPSADYLNKRFKYCKDTGELYWKYVDNAEECGYSENGSSGNVKIVTEDV